VNDNKPTEWEVYGPEFDPLSSWIQSNMLPPKLQCSLKSI